MDCYKCRLCGYVYDPTIGDPQGGVLSGIKFEDLPESWHCPKCGGPKSYFGKEAY